VVVGAEVVVLGAEVVVLGGDVVVVVVEPPGVEVVLTAGKPSDVVVGLGVDCRPGCPSSVPAIEVVVSAVPGWSVAGSAGAVSPTGSSPVGGLFGTHGLSSAVTRSAPSVTVSGSSIPAQPAARTAPIISMVIPRDNSLGIPNHRHQRRNS
jgi:hypothetical protein